MNQSTNADGGLDSGDVGRGALVHSLVTMLAERKDCVERAERWALASMFTLHQTLVQAHPLLLQAAARSTDAASSNATVDAVRNADETDGDANLLLLCLSAAGGIRLLCERALSRSWLQRALPRNCLSTLAVLECRTGVSSPIPMTSSEESVKDQQTNSSLRSRSATVDEFEVVGPPLSQPAPRPPQVGQIETSQVPPSDAAEDQTDGVGTHFEVILTVAAAAVQFEAAIRPFYSTACSQNSGSLEASALRQAALVLQADARAHERPRRGLAARRVTQARVRPCMGFLRLAWERVRDVAWRAGMRAAAR